MTGSYERGAAIVAALVRAGVRATMDPAGAVPPVVLVMPPGRTYDLPCGFTARWTLAALAPAAQGADRNSWAALDALADAAATAVGAIDADLVAYTLNGTTFPAYLLTFEEAVS